MKRFFSREGALQTLMQSAFPVFLSNLLQSCYNIVDMALVGRFTGSEGIAAVGSASMICYVMNSFCIGLTTGGTVVIAQQEGARDAIGQWKTVKALFAVSAVASLLLTAAGLSLYDSVFVSINLPAEAVPPARDYISFACLGTMFVFGYNAACAVLRGLGDFRRALEFAGIATTLNIFLDLLFLGPLGMEARGAALATVLSQGFSCVAAIRYLSRRVFPGRPRMKVPPIDAHLCREILKIGLPSALQMGVVNLSYLLVTGMMNRYGVTVAAAAGIGLKINTIAAMPCWAVGQAVTTLVGQGMGAGDESRCRKTARAGLVLSCASMSVTVLAVQVFVRPIVDLFDSNPEVIAEGADYLRVCCSINFFAYTVMYILDSFATGIGDSTFAMKNALLHSVAMRLLLSWALGDVLGQGFSGLCWGEALSPIPSFLLGLWYFRRGSWKLRCRR